MKKTLVLASLMACTFAHSAELYMAGDSIMAGYKPSEWPQYGWGQSLKSFMKSPENLHNFARIGWSARRFRESGRWENCIASKLKPGDWVIVSFGHNDSNRRRNKPPKNDFPVRGFPLYGQDDIPTDEASAKAVGNIHIAELREFGF